MSLPWDNASAEDIIADLQAFKKKFYERPRLLYPELYVYSDLVPHGDVLNWSSDSPASIQLVMRGSIMGTDVYVAIYPYSNTNPTNKYRVVLNSEWVAVIDGEKPKYNFTEYDNIGDALSARDRLNGVKVKNMHVDEETKTND